MAPNVTKAWACAHAFGQNHDRMQLETIAALPFAGLLGYCSDQPPTSTSEAARDAADGGGLAPITRLVIAGLAVLALVTSLPATPVASAERGQTSLSGPTATRQR